MNIELAFTVQEIRQRKSGDQVAYDVLLTCSNLQWIAQSGQFLLTGLSQKQVEGPAPPATAIELGGQLVLRTG